MGYRGMGKRCVLTGVIWAVITLLFAAALIIPLSSHAANWIPAKCCYQNEECVQIPASEVKVDRLSYRFTFKGKSYEFPIKDALFSEDGKYYACFPSGELRCFSAPQMQF